MPTYEVQDLSLRDKVVQTVHDLLNRGLVVPPVHVQKVNVVRSQLLQARFNGDMHRLEIVPGVVRFYFNVILTTLEVGGILQFDFISD